MIELFTALLFLFLGLIVVATIATMVSFNAFGFFLSAADFILSHWIIIGLSFMGFLTIIIIVEYICALPGFQKVVQKYSGRVIVN